VRSGLKRRSRLAVPEAIDITIDRARGTDAPWSKPVIRERIWRDAVGGRIADRARPVELVRGILWICVATSVWASELSLLSAELVSRLRERGVAVRQLRFRVGPIDAHGSPRDSRRKRTVRPEVDLPEELEGHLSAIGDDELRKEIAGAARANLAWQETLAPADRPVRPRRPR
jgi:hypothetical protein